jgi:hypothetical protein
MFLPNNQTLREEHERRLGLTCTWVVQFPGEGKSERDLDRHIQASFGVSRVTSCTYRRLARERLGAALPELQSLAGMLLEWGEAAWGEVESARRMPVRDRVRLRVMIIATLARLCPKHVVNWQPPASPPFSAEAQARFLAGMSPEDFRAGGGSVDAGTSAPDGDGTCDP